MVAISRHLFLALFFIIACISGAQTGPAGVGTSTTNVLWLKADKGTSTTTNGGAVSTWSDQSGNGINVTQTVAVQQPSYTASLMNGFPAIQFDNNNAAGQNDFLGGPDHPSLDNTPGYSFFTATYMTNIGSDARCIVSKRTSIDVDEAFMLFYWTPTSLNVDIDGLGDRQSTSPTTYTVNTGYILDAFYNGSLPTASRTTIYEEEILRKTFSETSTSVPNKPSPLNVGCTHQGNSRPFGGYISEIIIYTVTVNDAQRIIVNNYLSAKYNLPLSANDKYAGDNSGNGNYDREVAGIGRESSGSNPSFSASISGGLTISSNSGLDNTDYILAGHASTLNMQYTLDVGGMTGTANARWLRIWYVDITNTSTSINCNIEFDMSDGGVGGTVLGNASDYVLLYRAGQTGNWTELTTGSSIVGDRVLFNGYTLVNDGYYTIGTKNYEVSPLPIQLVDFNATKNEHKVDVTWRTSFEKDNDYYTVERSKDALNYEIVSMVKGAGNHSGYLSYKESDYNPYTGISYYRLKYTDYNGHWAYSKVVPVNFNTKENADSQINVFPNPSDGAFNIELINLQGEALIKIYDVLGREFHTQTIPESRNNAVAIITPELTLPMGVYLVTVTSNGRRYNSKLIVK